MAQLSSVATLNGVDPFDLTGFGQSYVWGSNGFLHSVDLYDNDPANSHTIDLSLSGANWVLREMSIGGNSARQISISDLDGGSQRNIELMQFFGGNAQISLQSTNIGTINAYDGAFDFAVMNPPFNEGADRASPDALRRSAHVMEDDLFERWLRTASAILRPRGGEVALIARPQSLGDILAALEGRFGGARILALHPRPDEPAIRVVLRAVRGSRAPLSLMPPLVLHDSAGNGFSARADAAINGQTALFDG